jgi:anaerobic magnesium-protoporphyrin IX monomethyl ester cyclase
MSAGTPRVLVVDLNNFARYPTVGVGYLVAMLRREGMTADVFSPLFYGVSGVAREGRPGRLGLVRDRLAYTTAVSTSPLVKRARAWMATRSGSQLAQEVDSVSLAFLKRLHDSPPDAVLISTYLMYLPLCRQIAAACKAEGIPVLIGGPYFYQVEVAREWIDIDGMSGLVGGEVEHRLPEIVRAMIAREDLTKFPGIWTKDEAGKPRWTPPPPLKDLDSLPFPDYSDFPWNKYPNRIVPIVTGRGCGWGACTFCSDITSTAGRTFRSRSPQNVLDEIAHHHQKYGAKLFAFVDLKLNSDRRVWDAIVENMQKVAPGAQWIASVHIGSQQPNGLSAEDLKAASAAGMVRVTTGLESGSQRVLDRMVKGTNIPVTSQVLRDAHAAGISVRNTMIVGFPGEEAEDVLASAEFLETHGDCIERVMLNRFQIMTGTHFHRALERHPERFPGVTRVTTNHRMAQVDHHYRPTERRDYRRAVMRLLKAVHHINRRPLSERAREFEGVM